MPNQEPSTQHQAQRSYEPSPVPLHSFQLAESLHQMEPEQSLPRDLPGPYGRAIKDLERLLQAAEALCVVAGG